MTYLKKGMKGFVLLLLFTFVANIIGYGTRAVLTRTLDPSSFGLFYAVFSLVTFLLLFTNLGFPAALIKHIAQFHTKKDFSKIKFSIIFSSYVRLVMNLIMAFVLFFLSDFLALYYFKSPDAVLVVKIFAVIMILIVLNRILANIFNGLQRNFLLGLLEFGEKTFFLGFIVVLIFFGFGGSYALPAWAFLIAYSCNFLVFLGPMIKKTRIFKFQFQKSAVVRKSLISFAKAALLTSISYMVLSHIDTLMLTYFRSLSDVGVYNVVLPTVTIISVLGVSLQRVFFPMATELWTKNLKDRLVAGFSMMRKYTLVVVVPLSLMLVAFPATILRVLFGVDYVGGSLAMQILAIGIIFSTVAVIGNALLKGIGKPKIVSKILLVTVLFNVVFNGLLIPFFGINGAAAATALSFLVMMVVSSFKLRKYVRIPLDLGNWVKVVASSIIFVGAVKLAELLLNLNIYVEIVLCFLIGAGVYLVCAYLIGLIRFKDLRFFMKQVFMR